MTPTFLNRLRAQVWAIAPSYLDTLSDAIRHSIALAEISRIEASPLLSVHGGSAVISINGALGKRLDHFEKTYMGMVDYDDIEQAIDQAEAMEDVDRIVFSFDSPGGSVLGIKELTSRMNTISKPTVSFTDTLMASAAYWLASQTGSIYASPSSMVGSIGARIVHIGQSRALEDAGIDVNLFGEGAHKNDFSPLKPLSDDEKSKLQSMVSKTHSEFRSAVESNRQPDSSVFASDLYEADEALDVGLVDGHLNSLSELLQFLE